MRLQPIDYGRSFCLATGPGKESRFHIKSRTRTIKEETGAFHDYYRTASCKVEATFAKKNLFSDDNYDGSRIFGPDCTVWSRLKSSASPDREGKTLAEFQPWGGTVRYHLAEAASVPLLTEGDIVEADFILLMPTSEKEGKRDEVICKVYHFSETVSLRARNKILALIY